MAYENSQPLKFIIGYGLSGGFGGIQSYEVVEAYSYEDAESMARLRSVEEYESHVGSGGLREVDEIMEDDDVDEQEAEMIYRDEMESWLDYSTEEYTDERYKEIEENYGF
jgi:hypothetical protein